MNKISDKTNPLVSGKYLVFYLPHLVYSLGRWEFASWDATIKKWYMYIPTSGTYRLTHWESLPDIPSEKSCEKGLKVEVNYASC
jgi:hypothetical protein